MTCYPSHSGLVVAGWRLRVRVPFPAVHELVRLMASPLPVLIMVKTQLSASPRITLLVFPLLALHVCICMYRNMHVCVYMCVCVHVHVCVSVCVFRRRMNSRIISRQFTEIKIGRLAVFVKRLGRPFWRMLSPRDGAN